MEIFEKIKFALKKTSNQIALCISGRSGDHDFVQAMEEALIMADVGVVVAAELSGKIAEKKFPKNTSSDEIKKFLANEIAQLLLPYESDFLQKLSTLQSSSGNNIAVAGRPYVMLMVGVNGNGKTTTLAKIAHILKRSQHRPMLVAADTFRAAAVEQLKYWANYVGVDFLCAADGADAAGLVFQSIEEANANGNDVVLIDTAGRMQNRDDLLAELEKIKRVMKKIDNTAPHITILVLDGITGQAAHGQVEVFLNKVGVDGVVVTKLDGTAKGGAIISLIRRHKIPVLAIGTGEGIEDLRHFNAMEYAEGIVGY
ncbi:MAG: signal recognition particle-docking protein FtsY [Holosporaceae bacterium]|jgi:fused signal recognition particle receptor|nr:signal recognition particle-docking protein FtsY [Holosporaceae bacterium]